MSSSDEMKPADELRRSLALLWGAPAEPRREPPPAPDDGGGGGAWEESATAEYLEFGLTRILDGLEARISER